MSTLLYALITVFAWGSWLAPSQNVPFRNQQIKTLYVAAANLALAILASLALHVALVPANMFWLTFAGGLIWALSGLCAFTATHKLGIARAFGIWAPLNILVSMIWGALLFNELPVGSPLNLALLAGSLLVIIAGALLIIFARGSGAAVQNPRDLLVGVGGALGAGVLWGTYFIPIKMASVSLWAAALPLAAGIFAGSAALAMLAGQSPRLAKTGDYLRAGATGLLWGVGNYGMLLLVDEIGAGKGFTISQLSVVVNGLIAIYWLKDPRPRSRAAGLTIAGCILATVGGIVLGNLK